MCYAPFVMLRGRCSCAISGRPSPLPRAIFAKGYSSTPRLLATSYTLARRSFSGGGPLATALLSPIIPACPERFLRRVLIDAPLSPIIPACPERFLRRVLTDAPLSLLFPVHPRNSPVSPIIPACPERFLRRVLTDAPLSLLFPVHPRNSPVSLIIPVHAQKQGGGGLKQLSATSNQRSGGKNKADPVDHSIPGGSNRLEEEWPASEGGPYTNRELSAVNCKPAFLTPAFTTTSIDIVGAPTFPNAEKRLAQRTSRAARLRRRPLQRRDGWPDAGRGLGAAGDVEKLLALHDEMRHATQRRG